MSDDLKGKGKDPAVEPEEEVERDAIGILPQPWKGGKDWPNQLITHYPEYRIHAIELLKGSNQLLDPFNTYKSLTYFLEFNDLQCAFKSMVREAELAAYLSGQMPLGLLIPENLIASWTSLKDFSSPQKDLRCSCNPKPDWERLQEALKQCGVDKDKKVASRKTPSALAWERALPLPDDLSLIGLVLYLKDGNHKYGLLENKVPDQDLYRIKLSKTERPLTLPKAQLRLPTCLFCTKNVSVDNFISTMTNYHKLLKELEKCRTEAANLRKTAPWAPRLPIMEALEKRAAMTSQRSATITERQADRLRKRITDLDLEIASLDTDLVSYGEEKRRIEIDGIRGVADSNSSADYLDVIFDLELVFEKIQGATSQKKVLECRKETLQALLLKYEKSTGSSSSSKGKGPA